MFTTNSIILSNSLLQNNEQSESIDFIQTIKNKLEK